MLHHQTLRGRCALTMLILTLPAAAIAGDGLPSWDPPNPQDPGGPGGPGNPQTPVPTLFSVDRTTNSLVSINRETGAVSTIGATGMNIHIADLTYFDGQLFGLVRESLTSPSKLVRFNVQTGAAELINPISYSGNPIVHAESLAHDGTNLVLGLSTGGYDYYANAFAHLSLDGIVSNVTDLSGQMSHFDLDGMGYDPVRDRLVSVDTRMPPTDLIEFHSFGFGQDSIDTLGILPRTGGLNAINDIEFIDDLMFAVDSVSSLLHIFDPENASLLESIQLSHGDLFGLAYGYVMVPGPGAAILLTALLGGGSRRRRR